MIGRILAVAANTRKEAFRNRAFLILVIVGIAMNVTGWALSKLAPLGQQVRVIQDFGYFAVSIVAVLSGMLIGVILLFKELERKTIYALIPKPLDRLDIVLGKFLGLLTLLMGLVAGLGACWLLFMWLQDALLVADQSVVPHVIDSLFLMVFEAMLITAVALFFSSWTRPLLAGIFTFSYFLVGRWVFLIEEHLNAAKGALAEPGPARVFAQIATYITPDLQVFNGSRELVLGVDLPFSYIVSAGGYALSFSAVFLVLAILLFSRRDFV